MSAKVSLITQVIIVKAPTTVLDIIPYAFVFLVYGLMVQAVFAVWKKFHEASYNYFILFAILATLPALAIYFHAYPILLVYLVFMAYMAYLIFTALNFSQKKNGPKLVFRAFKIIFLVTNHLTILFQGCLIFCFITKINKMLLILKIMAYLIYFAVLSREIVKNICVVMAKTTGFYSKEGVPGKKESNTTCMICLHPLIPTSGMASTASITPYNENKTEKAFTLRCGHSYHEDCIKGWALIGLNNCCYYCKESIDNKIFTQDYWLKSELFIKPVMNAMRSLIAFSIVVAGLLYVKLVGISSSTGED